MKRYQNIVAFLTLSMPFFVWGATPVGWRTDGSGSYPDAVPPRTWSTEKNVVWRTKMPAWSNSSPVIVGQKLFVCSEPAELLCLQLDNGKILWRKENHYSDVALPAPQKERLEKEQQQANKILEQIRGFEKESAALRRELAKNPANKDALQKKQEALKAQTDALKVKLDGFPLAAKFRTPKMNGTGGFSSPTPVSDGRHVYVAFGNGLVACYDLEGNRQWIRLIEHSTAPYGHGSSPLLVGNKLLVHYADLVALDIKNGAEVWRTKLPPNHGTSIHARIGEVDVAIHPNGALVRLSDGALLAENLGRCGPNSPILHKGIIYFIRPDARAVQLPVELSSPIKPAMLWKTRLTGSGYWFASPIYHKGLLYGINAMGILSVVDATTGKLVYDKRLPLGKGQVYPSITLAGDLLYISNDAGVTLVLEAGREHKQAAKNTLEPFRSTPVFLGKRMYVRTREYLYCIGE